MTARIVQIRGRQKRADHRRRQVIEASMREALTELVAGLNGKAPITDAVFRADAALRPAVREAVKAEIA